MTCQLPRCLVVYSGCKPGFASGLRPWRMYNCDEEFDSARTFFSKSKIPSPVKHHGYISPCGTVYGSCNPFAGQIVRVSTNASTSGSLLNSRRGGLHTIAQHRWFHHDLKAPDFSNDRLKGSKKLRVSTIGNSHRQRLTDNLGAWTAGVLGAMFAKSAMTTVINTMQTSKAIEALSTSEVNVKTIEPGKTITEQWQGRPVFIHRWTDAEIERERQVSLVSLRDPESVEQRCTYPEWLVVVGVCTHLGCIPIPGQGDFGGYFCPCHASHYDACGRVRKGPAPRNLAVPKYFFDEDGVLVIGANE